jgi:hypothetical protein
MGKSDVGILVWSQDERAPLMKDVKVYYCLVVAIKVLLPWQCPV